MGRLVDGAKDEVELGAGGVEAGSHLGPESADVALGLDVEAVQIGIEIGVGGAGGEQHQCEGKSKSSHFHFVLLILAGGLSRAAGFRMAK